MPQPSSSCSPDLFNPHILTANLAQQDKTVSSRLWCNVRRAWQPIWNGRLSPPPPDTSRLVVGDMLSLKIGLFGDILLAMHGENGDVHVRLLNVAYEPGVKFNLFSLHAVTQMREISPNSEGVHLQDGELTFPCRDAGSYVEASTIADAPNAVAMLAPGKIMRIDINDRHVSFALSHGDALGETARQMGVN